MNRFTFSDGVPLGQDQDGTIRATGSRITLDTIVDVYKSGDSLEQIHEEFPTLSFPQIQSIISWYLNNQAEAEAYLEKGNAEAERLRQEIQSRPEQIALREKIQRYREQLVKT